MSFQDIFKKSFLEEAGQVSLPEILVALVLAFVLGAFIMLVYKKTYQGVMYSRTFGTSLIAMTMISTFIILAVTSNVVLSLGMVGALSIVRFRSAVKDPLDIVYLFWAVGVGIVLGAKMYVLALIGCAVVGIVLFVFVRAGAKGGEYILVLECADEGAEKKAAEIVKTGAKRSVIKTKTVTRDMIEVTYEVSLKGEATDFVNGLCAMDGIGKAVLVSYNGDYMS